MTSLTMTTVVCRDPKNRQKCNTFYLWLLEICEKLRK